MSKIKRASEFDLNDPARFEDLGRLDPELQAELVAWIHAMLRPAKTKWSEFTSYGMKHVFEHDPEGERQGRGARYVYNGVFKGAMRHCGHEPVDASAQNWCFRVRPVNRERWYNAYCGRHTPRR